MRICVIYDCLFPYTVGGAERWYRNVAKRLAVEGHDVTYITMRQWDRGEKVDFDGVKVVAVGPRIGLYTTSGRRRISQALIFGIGVFVHLLRHGRKYDVVHTASFPYFSLLAAGSLRRACAYNLAVDWHEVWSREYWHEYLGRIGGPIGWSVQRLCASLHQHAFCFSNLHGQRLTEEGLRGTVTVLKGEYAGPLDPPPPKSAKPTVVFAGRHIPEKRVPALVEAMAVVHRRVPELRCEIYGDGPERQRVLQSIEQLNLSKVVTAPGFVESEQIEDALRTACCMVLPSRREGYGMIVIEAAFSGTPSIVVADPDNAATELISPGENGYIARTAEPDDLAEMILAAYRAGPELRKQTAAWFRANAEQLSIASSLDTVVGSYAASVRS